MATKPNFIWLIVKEGLVVAVCVALAVVYLVVVAGDCQAQSSLAAVSDSDRMQCFHPVALQAPSAKRCGLPVGRLVPCGKCNFCVQNRRLSWAVRLQQQLKDASSAYFVTLTLANENLTWSQETGEAQLNKRDLQTFFKRLRWDDNLVKGRCGSAASDLSYYSVAEYGGAFGRPHYHALLYDVHPATMQHLTSIWKLGLTHHGTVTPASINYVSGYMFTGMQEDMVPVRPFNLMSKGIGAGYLTPQKVRWHQEGLIGYAHIDSERKTLPRYYRERIFDEAARKVLAFQTARFMEERNIQKLDSIFGNQDNPMEAYQQSIVAHYNRIPVSKRKTHGQKIEV